MPNVSAFDDLTPAEVKAIEDEMARKNFKRLYQLEDWCRSKGWEIGRGAIYNRAAKVKRRLELVKASTLAMQQVADAVSDDEVKAPGAVMSLVQAETFECMLNVQEAREEEDDGKRMELLKSASLIAKRGIDAHVKLKKFQTEFRAKLEADLAAMKQAGFDENTLNAVQQKVAIYLPANNR